MKSRLVFGLINHKLPIPYCMGICWAVLSGIMLKAVPGKWMVNMALEQTVIYYFFHYFKHVM